MNRSECEALDRDDPLAPKRGAFAIPEGLMYLDGNSLGPLPRATAVAPSSSAPQVAESRRRCGCSRASRNRPAGRSESPTAG